METEQEPHWGWSGGGAVKIGEEEQIGLVMAELRKHQVPNISPMVSAFCVLLKKSFPKTKEY